MTTKQEFSTLLENLNLARASQRELKTKHERAHNQVAEIREQIKAALVSGSEENRLLDELNRAQALRDGIEGALLEVNNRIAELEREIDELRPVVERERLDQELRSVRPLMMEAFKILEYFRDVFAVIREHKPGWHHTADPDLYILEGAFEALVDLDIEQWFHDHEGEPWVQNFRGQG